MLAANQKRNQSPSSTSKAGSSSNVETGLQIPLVSQASSESSMHGDQRTFVSSSNMGTSETNMASSHHVTQHQQQQQPQQQQLDSQPINGQSMAQHQQQYMGNNPNMPPQQSIMAMGQQQQFMQNSTFMQPPFPGGGVGTNTNHQTYQASPMNSTGFQGVHPQPNMNNMQSGPNAHNVPQMNGFPQIPGNPGMNSYHQNETIKMESHNMQQNQPFLGVNSNNAMQVPNQNQNSAQVGNGRAEPNGLSNNATVATTQRLHSNDDMSEYAKLNKSNSNSAFITESASDTSFNSLTADPSPLREAIAAIAQQKSSDHPMGAGDTTDCDESQTEGYSLAGASGFNNSALNTPLRGAGFNNSSLNTSQGGHNSSLNASWGNSTLTSPPYSAYMESSETEPYMMLSGSIGSGSQTDRYSGNTSDNCGTPTNLIGQSAKKSDSMISAGSAGSKTEPYMYLSSGGENRSQFHAGTEYWKQSQSSRINSTALENGNQSSHLGTQNRNQSSHSENENQSTPIRPDLERKPVSSSLDESTDFSAGTDKDEGKFPNEKQKDVMWSWLLAHLEVRK